MYLHVLAFIYIYVFKSLHVTFVHIELCTPLVCPPTLGRRVLEPVDGGRFTSPLRPSTLGQSAADRGQLVMISRVFKWFWPSGGAKTATGSYVQLNSPTCAYLKKMVHFV